jgi:hypothetical protein
MSEEQVVAPESLDGSTSQEEAQLESGVQSEVTPEVDEDTLKEAKRQGWVPQSEYSGPEDKWVDADTFVKKGKEINALLRKDNEFLKREVSDMKSTMMEFKKFHAETEKRAYERAMTDLRDQKKEAISTGDGEKVLQIDDAIDELKSARQQEKAQAAVAPPPDATFIQWSEENKWYTSDAQLKTDADMIGEVIKRQNPTLIGEAFLSEVTTRVKRMYPEKFTNSNRNRPSPVEGTTAPRATGKNGKSFNDLPPEAKAACQKFEKSNLLTREQYLKEYFGE